MGEPEKWTENSSILVVGILREAIANSTYVSPKVQGKWDIRESNPKVCNSQSVVHELPLSLCLASRAHGVVVEKATTYHE